jgi:cytochrome c5
MKNLFIISIAALALFACEKPETPPATPATVNQPKDTSLSYQADIKQIFDTYCLLCHSSSYVADLSSYSLLKTRADNGLLNDRLFVKKDMPPVGYNKPSAAELQKIKNWISTGCKP